MHLRLLNAYGKKYTNVYDQIKIVCNCKPSKLFDDHVFGLRTLKKLSAIGFKMLYQLQTATYLVQGCCTY